MTGSLILLDTLVRGLTLGTLAAVAIGLARDEARRDVRLSGLLLAVTLSAWTVTQSAVLWAALGVGRALLAAAWPLGGAFWLFVAVVFAERPVSARTLAPAAALLAAGLLAAGLLAQAVPEPQRQTLWALRNLAVAGLMLHAGWMLARGWDGDLVAARRSARPVLLGLLGLGAAYGVIEAVLVVGGRFARLGSWRLVAAGQPVGALVVAGLSLCAAALLLQARPVLAGGPRVDAGTAADAGARASATDAADRYELARLEALMAGQPWRREGLRIGDLAGELGLPEHRLRRLINRRLGHRNFADFLNAYRVEAAKQRLSDVAAARTTVAQIAFDLGYGSLGPFNRAFRAATGATPTAWRRRALGQEALGEATRPD